jgi:hypothetical protein
MATNDVVSSLVSSCVTVGKQSMQTNSTQHRDWDLAQAPVTVPEKEQLAQCIVQAIAQNQQSAAIAGLRQLSEESSDFPQQWLLDQAYALETGNWNVLSDGFVHRQFIGTHGYFLIIAPYRVRREANELTKLTAILGQVIAISGPPIEKLEALLCQEFGDLRQSIPIILSYEQLAACGNVGGESVEAFIVANNWEFANSVHGPSLNNMTEQRRRFLDSGQECIRRIWEPDSAELLLSPLVDENFGTYYRSREYQLHEFGHASGLGFEYKVRQNLFLDYWNAAVEESRSDGVALELAANALLLEEAGKISAVNLCVRQALDAHRRGGLNQDGDVGASLLNFARLWDSGEIGIKNGHLYLRDLSYRSLLRAVKPLREWAMRLTREELSLDYPMGLFRLYGSIQVHPAVEEIFKGLVVEPCRGVFPELR